MVETQKNTPLPLWAWPAVIVLIVVSGLAYRILAGSLQGESLSPITPSVPLSEFPLEVGPWQGREVPIPVNVQKVAKNDDFLSRLYVNQAASQWASLYVAYTAKPRTMMGHRPQVCYPASGWIHDSTERIKVISRTGLTIPCLLHRFRRPAPSYEEVLIVNFYIVNGQLTDDESVFTGIGWRTPNIAGNPARYVAQVQISSVLENSIHSAARDFTDLILTWFPDSATANNYKPLIDK